MELSEIRRKIDKLVNVAMTQAIANSSMDCDQITLEGAKRTRTWFKHEVESDHRIEEIMDRDGDEEKARYFRISEKKNAARAAILSYLIAELEADHD